MADQHGYSSRYARPRSPVLYNPGRTSLPANVGYVSSYGDPTYPVSRREIPTHPRSSGERLSVTVPTTTTKYKVIPASAADNTRSSSLRAGSRSRSATVDSSGRSMDAPRLRPIIHSGAGRPASPISNPYRASDESAYLVPASSHHSRGHIRGIHSIGSSAEYRTKNADHLRIGAGSREKTYTTSSRGRPSYSNALVTASDDYTDPGYTFVNSRELADYDLNHKPQGHSRHRRESSGSSSRPATVMGITDHGAKSFDARERGPPPTTRHRDKVPTTRATYDVPVRARADLGYESDSRSRKPRPSSMYQERDLPSSRRDGAYDLRETEIRDRAPREKSHHHSRYDDDDRLRSGEKHSERKDHRTRESLAATLSLAAASALGLSAAAQNKEGDRDERDEPPRRARDDSDEERRRRRRADDRESRDKVYSREGGRDSPPRERESEYRRDPKDRKDSMSSQSPPQEKRTSPPLSNGGRPRHETVDHPKEEKLKNRARSYSGSTQSSDSSLGDRDRRNRKDKERTRAEPPTPTTPSAAFNPKDTMDLRALKEQLNRQDGSKESKRQSIASMAVAGAVPLMSSREKDYDTREDGRGRRDLIDETQPPRELREPQHQIRVVSPPRETQLSKTEEKPVKGILRTPREKFPEDPTHIREGVAPLKDAKKDGVPPNARWTKISRELVNPAALEAGKERYEEDPDFVTVLRVLSKEEIQQYATITESIRGMYHCLLLLTFSAFLSLISSYKIISLTIAKTAAREEEAEKEYQRRRHAERRERHERHKRDGRDHHRSSRRRKEVESESDTTDDDDDRNDDHVRAIEAPEAPRPRRIAFEDQTLMSGGLGDLKENANAPGTFTGYMRNPPPPSLAR